MNYSTRPGDLRQAAFPFEDLERLLEQAAVPSHELIGELERGKYAITDWIGETRTLKPGSPVYTRANQLRVKLSYRADAMRKALGEPTNAEVLAGCWDADRYPDAPLAVKAALWEAV